MTSPARRLVLLRHGQTSWNAERRIQGQLDSHLDETGVLQAKQVAPAIAALAPTLLHASDLSRARRTAEIVGEACGLAPVLDERLREQRLGERQGTTHEEYAAAHPDEFARFKAGAWDGIPGAETAAEVAERYVAALHALVDGLDAGQTGVAVSHGAAIRTGVAAFLGWPSRVAADLAGLGNCCRVELVESSLGSWRLVGYGLSSTC